MAYDDTVAGFSPLAYFKFQGDATDSSGNGHNGTNNGGVTFGAAGPWTGATAATFDGSNDYISASVSDSGDFTVVAWVYLTADGSYPMICTFGSYTTPDLRFSSNSRKPEFGNALSATALALNGWHMIAGVRDGSTLRLYVDGSQVATGDGSSFLDAFTTINIGRRFDSVGFLTGRIARVSIHGTALSAGNISALFADQAEGGGGTSSFSVTESSVLTGASGTTTINLVGTGTSWTGTPFSLTSPPTGWSIASQNVTSGTAATITLNRGTGTGTITVSDGATTATVTATATATTVQDGNWNDGATWDFGVVPTVTNGNIAVVDHDVALVDARTIPATTVSATGILTVSSAVIAGDSATAEPATNGYTSHDLNVESGGHVIVASGGTLSLKGYGAGKLTVQAGGTLEFDVPSTEYRWWNTETGVVTIQGDVISKSGGGRGFFQKHASGGAPVIDGGTLTRIGDATQKLCDISITTGQVWIDDGLFDDCGTFKFQVYREVLTHVVGNTWQNSPGPPIYRGIVGGFSQAAHVFHSNAFDETPTINFDGLPIGTSSEDDFNVFAKGVASLGAGYTSFEHNVIFRIDGEATIWMNGAAGGHDNLWVGHRRDGATIVNCHWQVYATGLTGSVSHYNDIATGTWMDGGGDFYYVNPGSFDGHISVHNSIGGKTFNGEDCGTNTTSVVGANTLITYEHCTWFVGRQSFIALGEAGLAPFAGMGEGCRSNIVWGDGNFLGGDSANIGAWMIAAVSPLPTDTFAAADISHNRVWQIKSGTTGMGVAFDTTDPLPASNTEGDPQFVSQNTSPIDWATDIGVTGTDLEKANAVLDNWLARNLDTYDSSMTPAAYKAWYRAKMAPQDATLQDAGHDGATIGAVEGVFGMVAGTLSEVAHDYDSVDLSWTSATGNTGTVAEQLQRSPSGAGTWSNVTGATASPATDSTVSASTAYDYRVSYTDDNSTVYSNTVSVTTDAAPAPNLAVTRGGAITDGGTDALGTVAQGSTQSLSYTITNDGDAPATLGTITVGTGLTITADPSGQTIAASGTATLTVSVDTSAVDSISAAVSIPSDDSDSPYNWTVTADVTDQTAPTVTSARFTTAAGDEIRVNLSETCTGTLGFSVDDGGAAITVTPTNHGTYILLALSRAADQSQTTLDYTPGDVADDPAGNALAAFSGVAVRAFSGVSPARRFQLLRP